MLIISNRRLTEKLKRGEDTTVNLLPDQVLDQKTRKMIVRRTMTVRIAITTRMMRTKRAIVTRAGVTTTVARTMMPKMLRK